MWTSVNIWSGSPDPLGAALTNPTELARRKGRLTRSYPVEVDGRVFEDAEAAYQAAKARSGDVEAAARIIELKLRQHPDLVKWVQARGGRAWLESCSHHTGARSARFQWWEGQGLESRFIRTLVEAYSRVAGERA
jgi:hypothetical protein